MEKPPYCPWLVVGESTGEGGDCYCGTIPWQAGKCQRDKELRGRGDHGSFLLCTSQVFFLLSLGKRAFDSPTGHSGMV